VYLLALNYFCITKSVGIRCNAQCPVFRADLNAQITPVVLSKSAEHAVHLPLQVSAAYMYKQSIDVNIVQSTLVARLGHDTKYACNLIYVCSDVHAQKLIERYSSTVMIITLQYTCEALVRQHSISSSRGSYSTLRS
jgi:hypothetical protein